MAGLAVATEDSATRDQKAATAVSRAAARAVARALPSVVTLRAVGSGRDGFGAGVFVREDGLVLTAHHVVKEATALVVVTDDGSEYGARVRAFDRATDLALLELIGSKRAFPVIPLCCDDDLAVGETVFAVGNAFGLGPSATRGILSARGRRGVVPGNVASLLQTDAAINPGSSGGALLNLRGEMVGLITAILTRTGGHQGVGFAVPARDVKIALGDLLKGEAVRRPWLGVRVTPSEGTLKVLSVTKGGPAERAGLRAGDRLLRLSGRPMTRIRDLRRVLLAGGAGAVLQASIRRGDRALSLDLTVGAKSP